MLFDLPIEIVASIVSYLILLEDINNFRLVSLQTREYASNFVNEICRDQEYDKGVQRSIYIRASYIGLFYHLHTVKIPIILLNRSDVDTLLKSNLSNLSKPKLTVCYDTNLTKYVHTPRPPYIQQLIDSSATPYEIPELVQFMWVISNPTAIDNIPPHILELATEYMRNFKTISDRKKSHINNFISWIRYILQTGPDRILFASDRYCAQDPFIWIMRKEDTITISGKFDPTSLLSAIPLKKIIFEQDIVLPANWSSLVQWKSAPYAGFNWISSVNNDKWIILLESISRFKIKLKSMFDIYGILRDNRINLQQLREESRCYPQIFDARVPINGGDVNNGNRNDLDLIFAIFPNTQTLTFVHHISEPISDEQIQLCFQQHSNLQTIRIYSHDAKDYTNQHPPLPPPRDIKRKLFKRIVHRK